MTSSPTTAPVIRVLHIDDEPRMRSLVADIISDGCEGGCEFFEGGDGCEAVPLFLKHQPDVVLMDFEMPVTDGISATRQLLARFPEARVVMLSLHDVHEAARGAGAAAFLSKSDLCELPELVLPPRP